MGEVIRLPPVYQIGYSDGEFSSIVQGTETRDWWEAEYYLNSLAMQAPGLMFWIEIRGDKG